MKDITLVILAAGMGSRFGGLKQIEPIGPNGEFIIDYSIYDAKKVGFNKVVFIIKEENYEIFKNTIGKRIESNIKVEYVFQKNDNLEKYNIPKSRTKPFGTAHAILCAKDYVNEPFAIINADDFYGREAFSCAYKFLTNLEKGSKEKYGLVGYKVKNTLTENGSVKRGICKIDNNKLVKIIESKVEKLENDIIATPLNGDKEFKVDKEETVSMNMLLFTPTIFSYIEKQLPEFIKNNKKDLETCEFLIPDVLFNSIEDNFAEVDVIQTNATWYGITYKEDTLEVKASIKKLVDKGIYNSHLWD